MNWLSCFLIGLGSIAFVDGHSWLDCLDWDDANQVCKGYPRNWKANPQPLGTDIGRDARPGANNFQCMGQYDKPLANVNDGYDATYKMSKLASGQKITMRWPAKNHATVGTQRGVQLLISKGPELGDDFSHISSVADWVTKYPKLEQTFSNCSPNQPNLDKISCIGEFELPGDLQPGVYTFMWWWEFNAGEFYNQCADVEITGLATVPTDAPVAATSAPVANGSTKAPVATTNAPVANGSTKGPSASGDPPSNDGPNTDETINTSTSSASSSIAVAAGILVTGGIGAAYWVGKRKSIQVIEGFQTITPRGQYDV